MSYRYIFFKILLDLNLLNLFIFNIEITYFHPDFAPCKQGFTYIRVYM